MRTFIVFLLCMAAGALILGVLQMTHTISVIGQENGLESNQVPLRGIWTTGMPIPSLTQLQTEVGCKPDNIFGPETKAKWDKFVNDQFARRHFKEKQR